jgi:microcystin-dependent protein
MWSGSVDNIPSGWVLCDGTNETPNLMDRFVIGSGNGYKAHATGGSSTKNLQHTHTTSGHALTIDQIPSHSHGVNDPGHRHYLGNLSGKGGSTRFQSAGPDSENKRYSDPAKTDITIQNTGGGKSHSHGDTGFGGSSAQDIMPPYYALCFIMKL